MQSKRNVFRCSWSHFFTASLTSSSNKSRHARKAFCCHGAKRDRTSEIQTVWWLREKFSIKFMNHFNDCILLCCVSDVELCHAAACNRRNYREQQVCVSSALAQYLALRTVCPRAWYCVSSVTAQYLALRTVCPRSWYCVSSVIAQYLALRTVCPRSWYCVWTGPSKSQKDVNVTLPIEDARTHARSMEYLRRVMACVCTPCFAACCRDLRFLFLLPTYLHFTNISM